MRTIQPDARPAINRSMMALARSVAPPNVGIITIAVFPNDDGTVGADVLTTLSSEDAAGVLSHLAGQAFMQGMTPVGRGLTG